MLKLLTPQIRGFETDKNNESEFKEEQENIDRNGSEYLRELDEWARNRYNPGFYTGGQLPPEIKYPTRMVGFLILFCGLVFSILAVALTSYGSLISVLVVVYFFAALQIAAGVVILLKKSHRQSNQKLTNDGKQVNGDAP